MLILDSSFDIDFEIAHARIITEEFRLTMRKRLMQRILLEVFLIAFSLTAL